MRRLLPLLASLVLLALPTAAHGYTFYEWSFAGGPAGIAQQGTGPLSVTLTASGRDRPGRRWAACTSAGVVITGAATAPTALAPGPGDGNLWFVDTVNGRVGRTDTGAGADHARRPTSAGSRPISSRRRTT